MPLECAGPEAGRVSAKSLGTFVVVEDPLVSNLVCAVLRKRGYEVRVAGVAEAAALLRLPEARVAALITNQPARFLEFADRVRLLYLTSQPESQLRASFPKCEVVLKPFAPEDLAQAAGTLTAAIA
jgi:hypothetical protein